MHDVFNGFHNLYTKMSLNSCGIENALKSDDKKWFKMSHETLKYFSFSICFHWMFKF